ncbi:MAG: hypothetical protein DDT26_02162 [Dehalococcoidia bacterium]|nr:hypothetical protein [Chloroflexota bacterium]
MVWVAAQFRKLPLQRIELAGVLELTHARLSAGATGKKCRSDSVAEKW